MTLEETLREQFARHPSLQAGDAVKLIYQRVFGCGHMIDDEAAAEAYLREEWAATEPDPSLPKVEEIGGGFVRLNLSPLRAGSLSPATLARLFILSAQTPSGDMDTFQRQLCELSALADAGALPGLKPEDLSRYLAEYRAKGCPAVHHTSAYRAAEKPAYRVVRADYARFLALFERVDALLAGKEPVRIAIDGRCASGKSTLGQLLAEVYGANLFHMDDFYIPMREKTPERLAQPGGNADTDRFRREVLNPLEAGRPFAYRVFYCHEDAFGPPIRVIPTGVQVVEGSYAHHPSLRESYDLTVFLTCDPDTQKRRILTRNGQDALAAFEAKWIPLEEAYFSACRTEQNADLLFKT